MGLLDLGHQALDVRRDPHVELRSLSPNLHLGEVRRDGLRAGIGGGRADNGRASAAQHQSDRPADSARCAGHQRNLAPEIHHAAFDN